MQYLNVNLLDYRKIIVSKINIHTGKNCAIFWDASAKDAKYIRFLCRVCWYLKNKIEIKVFSFFISFLPYKENSIFLER